MYKYYWEIIRVRIDTNEKTAMVIEIAGKAIYISFEDHLDKMGGKGWKLKRVNNLHSHSPKSRVYDIDRELIWEKEIRNN